MSDLSRPDLGKLTKEAIDALFTKALAGIAPAEPPRVRLAERIAPLSPSLLELRAKGFTTEQLSAALATEHFAINTTPATLAKVIATKRSRKAKVRKA